MSTYPSAVDVDPAARKHGVADDDMIHAFQHHWRAFETNDADITIGLASAPALGIN